MIARATPGSSRSGDHEGITEATLQELIIGSEGSTLLPTEVDGFQHMLSRHSKVFAYELDEIGCVDHDVVTPMVIFIVPHVPWNLRPLPVPRAHIPKVVELLKEKLRLRILEPSFAPYSSRWFIVPKKSRALRFIQDMQRVNVVVVKNARMDLIVDEFAEEFARRAIYSLGDLYSSYNQFQLAEESRDVTTMRTPLGLLRMWTLSQGATNSVTHIQELDEEFNFAGIEDIDQEEEL